MSDLQIGVWRIGRCRWVGEVTDRTLKCRVYSFTRKGAIRKARRLVRRRERETQWSAEAEQIS